MEDMEEEMKRRLRIGRRDEGDVTEKDTGRIKERRGENNFPRHL
jgi:hypothetical protein